MADVEACAPPLAAKAEQRFARRSLRVMGSRQMYRNSRLNCVGMTCVTCVAKLETTIGAMAGVRSISVGLLAERAELELNEAVAPIDTIIAAVEARLPSRSFDCNWPRRLGTRQN